MTPEQAILVKTTWEKVIPISDKAAELFYGKLFELDPSLKSLFKGDVKDEHYDTVGAALLWTLETGLGEAFTDEVNDAWATVYGVLADTMKAAAADAAA